MKKVLLGPSGGTAASMGAFMKYFVQKSASTTEIDLVPEMWRTMAGLNNRTLVRASDRVVDGWDMRGGSPEIPSCKNTNVFRVAKKVGTIIDMSNVVRDFCKDYDGIIAVGGGGITLQYEALNRKQGLNFIVALATMDNDICCFDNMLGFETAVQCSAASINACSNDARTMQRPTMVFSMGYECGRLAACAVKHARKHYGTKIDLLHIPETDVSIEDVAAKIRNMYNGGDFTIVISEGVCKSTGTSDGVHKKFSTNEYARKLMNLSGIEFKVLTPDYMQRSGIPVYEDRILADKFAQKALQLIDSGKWNRVIASVNDEVVTMPLDKAKEIIEKQNASSCWYSTPKMSLDAVKDILIK